MKKTTIVLLAGFLATPAVVFAASECGLSSPPCFRWALGQADSYPTVREDLHGTTDTGAAKSITPSRIANDGNFTAPSWAPTDRLPAYYPTTGSNQKLFIFFPGQPDPPTHYEEILRRAASHGYHALGIHYWNSKDDASYGLCNEKFLNQLTPSRDDCLTSVFNGQILDISLYSPAHRNGLGWPNVGVPCYPGASGTCYGTATGNALNISDPLVTRLYNALGWLHQNFPNQGWDQFMTTTGDRIAWGSVVAAGHSTGSKVATHLARLRSVARLLVFSGPHASYVNDDSITESTDPAKNNCASAMFGSGNQTATSKMYFYDETSDGKYWVSQLCHTLLGVGDGVDITSGSSPWNNAHVLKFSGTPSNDCGDTTGDQGHRGTVSDCGLTGVALPYPPGAHMPPTPSVAQTFSVWDYFLTAPF